MQTILGAGGAIGVELAKSLPTHTDKIRLVSRKPQTVNTTDLLFPADLSNPEDVHRAVDGSEVAYLTVGLTYNIKIWREYWPRIMKNVLDACEAHGTSLVFFDNIYMYDSADLSNMTEDHPVNPPSQKGKVRAQIAQMVMDAHEKGKIKACIARAADFYGPGINKVSMMTETILNPLSEGKKAQLIGRLDKIHSFTYTPDAGYATALLGNTESAFGEVWHLPTHQDPFTMQDYIDYVAKNLGVEPKSMTANKFMIRTLGLFVPLMKELVEMYYQYDQDYVFNSDKFEKRFQVSPTSYEEGLDHILRHDYKQE